MKKIIWLCLIVVLTVSIIFSITIKDKYDPYFSEQWALKNAENNGIDAKEMWKLLSKVEQKKEIVIAVLDTGVDFDNSELCDMQWINKKEIPDNGKDDDCNGYIDDYNGWSFVENNGKRCDIKSYHGTVCSEIIAARHNGAGIKGVIGDKIKVKIMDLKISSSNGYDEKGKMSDVVEAVEYADCMGADICNMSFSCDYDSNKLKNIMKTSNMLFVVSAGNNFSTWKIDIDKKKKYPASYDLQNMIVVTNINEEGKLDFTANYGRKSVDLAAPGTDIVAVDEKNEKHYYTGTSFAVAYVTGVAAAIYAVDENIQPYQAKDIICNSVTKNDNLNEKCKTAGILNGKNAIKEVLKLNERK